MSSDHRHPTRRRLEDVSLRELDQRIYVSSQWKFLTFAIKHRLENSFCAKLADQGWVSKKQAFVLHKIATDNEWKI